MGSVFFIEDMENAFKVNVFLSDEHNVPQISIGHSLSLPTNRCWSGDCIMVSAAISQDSDRRIHRREKGVISNNKNRNNYAAA